MERKYIQILIAVLCMIAFGGWQIYSRKKNAGKEAVERSSFIPVVVEINAVFPSGTGFRRSTIITVNYSYNDTSYVKTIRKEGYVEGRYKKGDTMTLYLNRENPEDIVTKISPNF